VTVRRGGLPEDLQHRQLAAWAADCAARVLPLFERERSGDDRPRRAIEQARAWARGEITLSAAREAAYAAHAAARDASGAARHAAGHAVATAHMADHKLGATAYPLKAILAETDPDGGTEAIRREREWQRANLPDGIRELVLDDQGCATRNCGRSSATDAVAVQNVG
jgi:hypothetical protein